MRRRVLDTESDNMADKVLSQGGTSVSSQVQYEYKSHDYGQRYSTAIGVQRCSNLMRANILPAGTQDFDMVNAMTNLVIQAMSRMDLPHWLPMRSLPHWRHYADNTTAVRAQMQTHLCANAKKVLLSVAHGGGVPEVGDADAALWLKGFSTESRLLRWVACSDFVDLQRQFMEEGRNWPENSTFAYWWQTLEDRVLRCVEGIILASTMSHCSLHFRRLYGPQERPARMYHHGFCAPVGTALGRGHWVPDTFRCKGTPFLYAAAAGPGWGARKSTAR